MWRRMAALVGGVAIVAASLSAAFIFVGTGSTRKVAEASRDLHWANSSAAAVSTMRAALSQALIFGVDRELGVAADEAVDSAMAEARRQVVAVYERLADPTATRVLAEHHSGPTVRSAAEHATAVITLLESRDVLGADAAFVGSFEPAYMTATLGLDQTQEELAGRIAAAETLAGRVEAGTRLLVTLLIPVLAILIYRRLAQGELRRRRLTMSARLEAERELGRAKDEFIAGISHELRTPLTSIYGFSEYLLDRGVLDPAEAIELIGLINNESADLSRMVEDLLTAARLDADSVSFAIEPVDVKAEIESVVAPMQRGGHDIRVVGHNVLALADGVRVRQIARNLVSNSLKHGGPRIEIGVAAEDDRVVIRVSDNGAGISEEMQEKLFERFAHEGPESLLVGSVGLGLAIARTLARRMGGDLVAEPDHIWTTFTCSLPLAPAYAVSSPNDGDEPLPGFAPNHDRDAEFEELFGSRSSDSEPAEQMRSTRITFDHG